MVLPASIDLRHPENYVLTLRISSRAIFFMISTNDELKRCMTCKKFVLDQSLDVYENIKKLFFELSFLSIPFHNVVIQWVNVSYILEPNEMFELYKKQELYSITQMCKENAMVLLNKDIADNTTLLFQIDKSIHGFLTRNLFQPIVLSHITPLVKYMTSKTSSLKSTFMYVNCFEDSFDVLLFKSNKLMIAQSYDIQDENEMFYFVVKIWEDAQLNQLEDTMYFNGFSSDLIHYLKVYIRYVEPFILPSEMNLWTQEVQIAPLDMISLLV